MTLYINWHDRQILTEEEKEEYIDNRVEEFVQDRDSFEDFMTSYDNTITYYDIFQSILEQNYSRQEEIVQKFRNWCVTLAEEEFEDDFEAIEKCE